VEIFVQPMQKLSIFHKKIIFNIALNINIIIVFVELRTYTQFLINH